MILIGLFPLILGISKSSAQEIDFLCETQDPVFPQQEFMEGTYETSNVLLRGGKMKTTVGTLRVMVIFVRFADDVETTSYWPDVNTLPTWATAFVDNQIPANNIYPSVNLSNFFDRASGGDGAGNLGIFQLIGDVFYVTTDGNQNSYTSDAQINNHVWQKLDNQGVNFKLYDNWRFMANGEYYNHEYSPGVGDGLVDHIFMMYRRHRVSTITGHGGYIPMAGNFTTNDAVSINGNCGSNQYGYRVPFDVQPSTIFVPAHEYTHWLFGGGQVTGHLDGESVYGSILNRGNIRFFGLMTSALPGDMSAYERYRAGWLEPTIIETNTSYVPLLDTHVKNRAVMIPIRYDGFGNRVEYFLVENFQSQNDYAGASPFTRKSSFTFSFTQGLLVFHIEEEDLTLPAHSNIDMECADGLWQWNVTQGGGTPTNRTDDAIARSTPTYHSAYDERDHITITVGSTTYTDYLSLKSGDHPCGTGNPCVPSSTCTDCNHGWRYTESSVLGDNEDFFRIGDVDADVFSSYSNPDSWLASGSTSTRGVEVISYNSTTKEYILKVGVDYSGVLDLKPSRPQNLKVTSQKVCCPTRVVPKLTWIANGVPDMASYEIFRAISNPNPTSWFASVIHPTTTYYDYSVTIGSGLPVFYRIKAKDSQAKLSSYSNTVTTNCSNCASKTAVGDLDEEVMPGKFYLEQNYPNPFNPTSRIQYDVAEDGFVRLSVYNAFGQEVLVLVNGFQSAGSYEVNLDASGLASGVYIYRLQSGVDMSVKKMILMK